MSLGGLETTEEIKTENTVIDLDEERTKRKPFHYWNVGGREYKLKLKTAQISRLENKYKCNIMKLVEDIPPLDVMLTIVQAAMEPWEHGIKFERLQSMFDQYVDEGGDQITFYVDVILPTLSVSGFFTEKMANGMMEALQEI